MAELPPGTAGQGHAPGVRWTLGGILRAFLPHLSCPLPLDSHQRRVLGHLAACGTGQLGANVYCCAHCRHYHFAPRSCGDRHCPACLAAKSHQWLQKQLQSLLPVSYFHLVFTLPAELHALTMAYPAPLYKLLFDSAAQTLLEFGRNDLGGDLGLSAVLHTWGQQLSFHPHLHCIVTGGALSQDRQRWRQPKGSGFLFHVKALGAMFRGKFLHELRVLVQKGDIKLTLPPISERQATQEWFSKLYERPWVVYAKRPFGGPEQVLRYLSNYTHRVALSNRRILAVDEQQQTVAFAYRDYRDGSKNKIITLNSSEFIRRFSLHILPPGLVRIRHYGILANNRRARDIPLARDLLSHSRGGRARLDRVAQAILTLPAFEPMRCPACQQSTLQLSGFLDRHGKFHPRRPKPAIQDST